MAKRARSAADVMSRNPARAGSAHRPVSKSAVGVAGFYTGMCQYPEHFRNQIRKDLVRRAPSPAYTMVLYVIAGFLLS